MAQVNLHVTEQFERELRRFMRARGIPTKSAAIRTAVHEGSERSARTSGRIDYLTWVGLARRGRAKRRRFATHDDLWR